MPMRSALAGATALALTLIASPAVAQQQNDNGLNARIEQLEQQLVEMQVTIGTLETLAKGGVTRGAASGGGNADVRQLEIQIRAMSGQIAALSRDVRALQQGGTASTGALSNNSFVAPAQPSFGQQPAPGTFDDGASGGFGSVTVTPEGTSSASRTNPASRPSQGVTRDPIGSILSSEGSGQQPASARIASASASPRAAYDVAYGHLLDQNFGAAESAFSAFVKDHPEDKLAGNAQYWLGESHYVRENYLEAAKAFLTGYKRYNRSAKAPDSLLKLAMSLSRLNQKPKACAALKELQRKFPSAPAHVARRSTQERQRAGC
ncbi:MAG: tol-pal system protein YbgF [Pseudomonadota bacterium]